MVGTLDNIFSALTPWLCIFALSGAGLFLWRWRTHSKIVWGAAVCSLFALAWRLLHLLASTRYAMFLILPAIVLGCYAAVNIKTFFPKLNARMAHTVQLLLIIALPLGLLAKSWHFSPYYNSLRELGEIAKADAVNFIRPVFFAVDIHEHRFIYYSGMVRDDSLRLVNDFSVLQSLKWQLESDRTLYIIGQIKVGDEHFLTTLLSELPGKSVKLGERLVNRKKRHKFVLYRYQTPKYNKLSAVESLQYQKNLYQNGDFEKTVPMRSSTKDFFIKRNTPFFARENIIIPSGMEITWLGEYNPKAELEAVNESVIGGKYSLRVKDGGRLTFPYKAEPGSYKYNLLVKSLADSVFNVIIFHFNPCYTHTRNIAVRKVPRSDQVWRYEITIPENILGKCTHFWVVFALHYGEVLLDNVSLTKIPPPSGFLKSDI